MLGVARPSRSRPTAHSCRTSPYTRASTIWGARPAGGSRTARLTSRQWRSPRTAPSLERRPKPASKTAPPPHSRTPSAATSTALTRPAMRERLERGGKTSRTTAARPTPARQTLTPGRRRGLAPSHGSLGQLPRSSCARGAEASMPSTDRIWERRGRAGHDERRATMRIGASRLLLRQEWGLSRFAAPTLSLVLNGGRLIGAGADFRPFVCASRASTDRVYCCFAGNGGESAGRADGAPSPLPGGGGRPPAPPRAPPGGKKTPPPPNQNVCFQNPPPPRG